ncbi:MAG: nuclear transport factor 2 family protein, partial [Terricaulis sp.]
MSTHAPEIQALLDKAAITDVINNYLRAADRADIDLLKTCYHDDAWEDHGGVFDGTANDYIAIMAKALPRGGIMNHHATNIIIELEDDKAKVEHYILAYARMKKEGEKFDTLTLARAID